MPASTFDIDAALRSALSKNEKNDTNNLDAQLTGATKRALLANIEFESSGSYQSTVLDKLKSKYIVLKSAETPQPSKPEEDANGEETLKLAKQELYPLSAVQLGWKNCDWSVGAGMINMGNTCYLNSTLQALFHVPALANWLMSDKDHIAECQDSGGLCIICAMRKTLHDSQQRNANAIRPLLIYNKLRLVCRNLIPGRQEDAHEFLRYLVEAMEKSFLSRFKNSSQFDVKTKETTPLNQILGGYLRSAVRCLKCGHVSTTFQHFQDLLLDIRKAQNLDEALELYFSREKLDDESYRCESCQKKVPATKQFSLERAPMVLCIQLKRFSVSNNKISKHLSFRQRLDLTRYAKHRPNVPLIYRLVALVTHMGPTVSCGHYTAVAQAPSGSYYQFDDSMVRPIPQQAVFNTNAYIMFYELESSPFSQKSPIINVKSKIPSTTVSSDINTPQKINILTPKSILNNTNNLSSTQKQTLSDSPNKKPNVPLKPLSNTNSSSVGYTSDKIYGPELPPNRLDNKNRLNDDRNRLNDDKNRSNGAVVTSSSSSAGKVSTSNAFIGMEDSDSDNEPSSKRNSNKSPPSPPIKEADSSTSSRVSHASQRSHSPASPLNNKNTSPSSSPCGSRVSTSVSSLSSPEPFSPEKKSPSPTLPAKNVNSPVKNSSFVVKNSISPVKSSIPSQKNPKSLVPYDSGDSSSSEDSSQSPTTTTEEAESRVSTKAAVGEWHVTSSSDVTARAEPSSEGTGKSWEKKKATPSSNNVVGELFKMSTAGYCAPVTSWNGTRSQLDKEIDNERREDRKRSLADSTDEGRVKHMKTQHSSHKSNPGYNPVQEFHNAKNWGEHTNGSRNNYYKSFHHGNRHRRNFNNKNKYHKNNYRFR